MQWSENRGPLHFFAVSKLSTHFEGGDGVFAVGRDEFQDLVSRHALLLMDCEGQLLADVVGHLNDHTDRVVQS